MTHRYYTTQRPPMPGAVPMRPRPARVEDFGSKADTGHGFAAWGFVEYDEPLTAEQMESYELREAE